MVQPIEIDAMHIVSSPDQGVNIYNLENTELSFQCLADRQITTAENPGIREIPVQVNFSRISGKEILTTGLGE